MSLARWQPYNELRRMQSDMDRMFENFFQPSIAPTVQAGMTIPLVDVFEQDNEIIVKAEVPGLNKENLQVTATNDSITLKGEFQKEEQSKEKGYIWQERRSGSFFRSIPMPNMIKADQVKANFKDGVLTIDAPLAEESKANEICVNIES